MVALIKQTANNPRQALDFPLTLFPVDSLIVALSTATSSCCSIISIPSSGMDGLIGCYCPITGRIRLMRGMQEAEHGGGKEERSDGGKEQTADDCPAQRCILLASFAETYSHRDHTDDHGERRHQHRTKPG